MYIDYNPNPMHKRVGDCAVRAIAKATKQTWAEAYIGIVLQGYLDCNMPSANSVWGDYLKKKGFTRKPVAEGITVARFAHEHSDGIYVLALNNHVVTIVCGNIYDSWDCSDEVVIYYWEAEEHE